MKKQSIFVRVIIVFFSLLMCVLAVVTTLAGMLLGTARKVVSAEFLAEVLGNEIKVGAMLNTLGGNEKYAEDATFADVTLEKLDPQIVEKYNLTKENLDMIYEMPEFKAFVSQKMENAVQAATDGGTFELTSSEIVEVVRNSEDSFTEITGVELTEEQYAELEQAVADAGFESYQYDFSEMGTIEGVTYIKKLLSLRPDLMLYGVTLIFIMFIFLFNLRNKHRTLLYAGGVVLFCGIIAINLKNILMLILQKVAAGEEKAVEPIVDILSGAARMIGSSAMSVGAVLLVLYVAFAVYVFVKRTIVSGR